MDERTIQLKQLKKEYKSLRRRAGLAWKILGYSFMTLFVICAAVTVFVCCNRLNWVQFIDKQIWQPVKSALALPLPYGEIWQLAARYGLCACLCTGVPGLFFLLMGSICKGRTKTSDAYRNYRTMRLTLETEKEENG